VKIEYTVENLGRIEGQRTIELYIEGEFIEREDNIILSPGELQEEFV